MTALDDRLLPKVLAIVEKFGIDAVFDEPGTKTYDPTTGETTESGNTNHTEKVTPPEGYPDNYMGGDVVKQGDVQIYLPAFGLGFTPVVSLDVAVGGKDYHLVGVDPVYSGEEIALYRLQLRR